MIEQDRYSERLAQALNGGVLKRLPLTFLPFVNQQLHQWEFLFPNEQNSVERLLLYVADLTPERCSILFRGVLRLEEKMGVRHWDLSTSEQTIRNSSELARSPYFQDWRAAVLAVYDAAESASIQKGSAPDVHRAILLEIPKALALDAATAWDRWVGVGKIVNLDRRSETDGLSPLGQLLESMFAKPTLAGPGNLAVGNSNAWILDAGGGLIDSLVLRHADNLNKSTPVLLSYGRLERCRRSFSHEMNTMRKDLADADAVFDRLRGIDIAPWCPPEVAGHAAVREFVRSLFLSGNGAVIFGNSFVEWAASEAFRRARPRFLAAQFGVRSKPKPFTGVAVFDDPEQVNPLPAADDFEGSAIDAQMLAYYVWLAASRDAGDANSTVCICIAECLSQAYVVAPPSFNLWQDAEPVALDRLTQALDQWLA